MLAKVLVVLALLTTAAAAQEAGGQGVSGPGFGQLPLSSLARSGGLAGPPAHAVADVQASNPARARQATDQQAIARIRGDAGFLGGFQSGQPLAASRQPPPELPSFLTVVEAPVILNNLNSAVELTVGNNNNTQQTVVKPSATPSSTTVTNAVNAAVGQGNIAVQKIGGGLSPEGR